MPEDQIKAEMEQEYDDYSEVKEVCTCTYVCTHACTCTYICIMCRVQYCVLYDSFLVFFHRCLWANLLSHCNLVSCY